MSENSDGNPFNGPQMQNAHYQRADMTGTNFDGVNLHAARFFAVMTTAKFTDTNLGDADFDDVNLKAARFHNVNLSDARITYANLSDLKISDVNLANAEISNADLTGMRINGVLVKDLFDAYETSKA